MPTPAETGLQRWHQTIESRDPGRLPVIIAEDAVFHSPAVHTPQEGRDLVTAYLAGAMVVLGPTLRYQDEWVGERDAVLRFTAEVDGLQVEGVDIIRWDDEGQIVDFTVMVRPFKALQAVMGRMLEELTRATSQS
ncbi:nuclear transport factor 2 family protein [Nocardioides pocheonensis]|uniref:Nuclear transport factor 2 family protein n=1 Tax=Nocardioides pocheonensis TaxID=661485 RepID=A0A3N0GVU2_9ACTN|nr:nuclear transport factor 2 family protein [Nocardioides pocheonensis]RNM16270.1 nuclear transport factor 2 family protein [Nocardioides pocheonensis]